MRFSGLLKAIGTDVLVQIPLMGPVFEAILAEHDRDRLEARLDELIRRLSIGHAEPKEADRPLVAALHLAQAELNQRLIDRASPQGRFLYLAGKFYAGPERTQEIAEQHGFLWRSFYDKDGKPIRLVQRIKAGDIIALAYRIGGNKFRLMLPLVVVDGNENTLPIDPPPNTSRLAGRDHAPFVRAGDDLSVILKDNYAVDPKLGVFTGLAVKTLFTDVEADVLRGTFKSPGANALWRHNYRGEKTEVPPSVSDWIASLGERSAKT